MSDEILTDDELLAELGAVLRRLESPPQEVVEAGKGLFTWRTIDAELAALIFDSIEVDTAEPAGVRAGGQPRILTFEAAGLTIEVEVDETPGARRLIGQLTPPGRADLELRTPDQSFLGGADELGRFVLDLPPQRLRSSLRIRRAQEVAETSWVTL